MKKNISFYDEYREIIKDLSKEASLSFKKIAESCQIHSSYFSRVMVDKADFNQEQLYKIAKALDLLDWEIDYLLALGELAGSGNVNHKNFVQKRINKLKEEHQKLKRNLHKSSEGLSEKDIESLYTDPLTPIIYLHLTIKRFRDNTELISKKLGLSKVQLNSELQKLQKLGIIRIEGKNDIFINIKTIHFDEANPIFNRFLINRRIDSLSRATKREKGPSDYQFSVLFSSTEEKKKEIKALFLEFVRKAQKASMEGEKSRAKKDLFSMNFDLY